MDEKKTCPQGCSWASRSGSCKGVEFDPVGNGMMRKKLLLHSCCGPCSTAVIERLLADYEITVFFYNPCITDAEEYEKRKLNQIKFIEAVNRNACCESGRVNFIEGDYDPENYLERVRGTEDEPEGGARCTECFRMREELKKGNRTIFSDRLYLAMKENLNKKMQIILFINRRGYSTFVSCRDCGEALKCPECGISLVYHKNEGSINRIHRLLSVNWFTACLKTNFIWTICWIS